MALWIFFTFLVWLFIFRGFFNYTYDLESDALSYHDHTKFFFENLRSGIFPLWDPYWCNGAPNDFFLRRIGALNPIYILMAIFSGMGLPYHLVYLVVLALYYWSGMIAFYLLAMRVYQDRLLAYAGYLMLLFSALGTRIFDSYMMLVTVPLIWLFYFLISFSQNPRKDSFLGLILSLMVLVSTYIPFYFFIIFVFFVLAFCILYMDQCPLILRKYLGFFKENKLLVIACLLCIGLSLVPLLSFFKESLQGHLVMPVRHGGISNHQILTVPQQTLDWGAVEDLFYSGYFSDLRMFKFAVVYVPFFVCIVIGLGLLGRLSRRASLMFILGVGLFICIVPHGLPFYNFLYHHFPIFKFFRNLHFFIWFFLIPLFVFLGLEHWHLFKQFATESKHKYLIVIYIAFIHISALLFVLLRKDAIISTYIMIALSYMFWSLLLFKGFSLKLWSLSLLTITVLIQPLEAYHYFNLKHAIRTSNQCVYDFSFHQLKIMDPSVVPQNFASKSALYYATDGYNFFYNNLSADALSSYLRYKFILVDHLEVTDSTCIDVDALNHHLINNDNTAMIFDAREGNVKLNSNDSHPALQAMRITQESDIFKVLYFDADHIRIQTNFPYEKFLIYNDSYTPDWKGKVNNQPEQIYEVNGAFKGMWIPAGKSIIEFNYGNKLEYALNIFLSFITFIILMSVLYYVWRN